RATAASREALIPAAPPPRARLPRGPPPFPYTTLFRSVLAVEDTRRLHRLASDLEVTLTGRVVTFHESVEHARLPRLLAALADGLDRKSTRLNSSHSQSSYGGPCLKQKTGSAAARYS